MYLPPYFEETRSEVLAEFIAAHPLGTLVVGTPEGLEANPIPFEFDPNEGTHGILRGHVARQNPAWRHTSAEALVIFQGPGAYVSPSWYPSKPESGGKAVPTWNYATAHAYGSLAAVEDRDWLLQHLSRATNRFEGGREHPWQIADAPQDFIDRLLGLIVGIEITLTRVQGKWKLSQNRPEGDRIGVIAGLEAEGSGAVAALMAARAERGKEP